MSQLQGRSPSRSQLLSRENSKKAHLGRHIYGIKCLARSQFTCNGKGRHETPCTHNFLCSLINESWKSHLLFMCQVHDRCSKLICIDAHCVTLLLCGFSENRLKLGEFTPGYGSGLYPVQSLHQTTASLVRGRAHLSVCFFIL